MIGGRIREERERLKLTQPAFADIAGVKKRTVIDWEKGASSPTAVQLASLCAAGLDALYVVTGQRQSPIPAPALDEGDRVLLRNFHAAPLRTQNLLRAFIEPSSDTPGEIEERPAQKAA